MNIKAARPVHSEQASQAETILRTIEMPVRLVASLAACALPSMAMAKRPKVIKHHTSQTFTAITTGIPDSVDFHTTA